MHTLSDILGSLTDVRAEADGYVAACPAHSDSHPSLRVAYNEKTKKVIVSCRAGCATSDVLAEIGLTFSDLSDVEPGDVSDFRTVTSGSAGPSVGDRAALATYLHRAAASPSTEALDYASQRFGITAERFAEMGLGSDDGTVPAGLLGLSSSMYHDVPRLVVPFRDFQGNPHYLQARALSGSPRAKWSGPSNPDGATWGKYGYFTGGTGWTEVLITEGPGDALTACAVGYDVVLIRGAGLASNQALLDELAVGLAGRPVVVAGDTDRSGQRFTSDLVKALTERGVDTLALAIPEIDGVKDLTDWRANDPGFERDFVTAVQAASRPADVTSADTRRSGERLDSLFSDVFNARILLAEIRRQGADIIHTSEVGFIVYKPSLGVWKVDDREWVRQQAQAVAPVIRAAITVDLNRVEEWAISPNCGLDPDEVESIKTAIERKRKAIAGHVRYLMSTRGLDAMLRELRALDSVGGTLEEFDQHNTLLAVRNGVVDLETGNLMPFSRETKELRLMRRIDQDYTPTATCPRWEQFLAETFAEYPEFVPYVQRLVGYGITGLTSEQCFAILWGTGANGKSVFTDVLSAIFDGIVTTTAFATFEARPSGGIPNDLAALKGSRLVMASEGNQGKPMDEAVMKRITGQDRISARFMRKEFFEFYPTFLIMLATNYRPQFRGQDEGLWRRVKLIPFTRYFKPEERDHYLAAKLSGSFAPRSAWRDDEDYGDGPAGILAWAIAGAKAYFEGGLQDPQAVTEATADYRTGSDALSGFLGDVVIRDANGKIKGSDLWDAYVKWCDEEGMPSKDRWTRRTFWGAMEERGAGRYVRDGSVWFRGIRKIQPSERVTGDPSGAHLSDDSDHVFA